MKKLPPELIPQPQSAAGSVALAQAALAETLLDGQERAWLTVLGETDSDGGEMEMFGACSTERDAACLAIAALWQWLTIARKTGNEAGIAKATLMLTLSGAHVDGVTGGIVRSEDRH